MPPFNDVLYTQGQDNMGGLIGNLFFVPTEDVDETALIALVLEADGMTLASDIPLKANKKFFEIYHTRGTGKIDANMVGERDGRSLENMFEFKYPGDDTKIEAFKRQFINTPGVWIVKDPQGRKRLFGISIVNDPSTGNDVLTLDFPAYAESVAHTTGTGSDAKGHTIQVKQEGVAPPLFYTGNIDQDDQT